MERANTWSEITGTAFYKVIWSGDEVCERTGFATHSHINDIKIVVCSPFEIYPDNINAEDITDCRSLIHAKVYRIDEIERIWGTAVSGQEVDVFDVGSTAGRRSKRTIMENAAVVIERYERPSIAHPNGRLDVRRCKVQRWNTLCT